MIKKLLLIMPLIATACYLTSPRQNRHGTQLNSVQNIETERANRDRAIGVAKMALDADKLEYGMPPTIKAVGDSWVVIFPRPKSRPARTGFVTLGPGAVEVHVNMTTLKVELILLEPN